MKIKDRIAATREIYINNLKKYQKRDKISNNDLETAIKFINSYCDFLLWSLQFK